MSHPKISEEEFQWVQEGSVKFLIPKIDIKPDKNNKNLELNRIGEKHVPKKSEKVFYNPKQVFNREISTLILKAWSEIEGDIESLLEPLCASGIRILRYFIQGPSISKIVGNDVNPLAIEIAKLNLQSYHKPQDSKIEFYNMDARKLFMKFNLENIWFNVVDIDPFGSPQPFLSHAINILGNPGLLFVTATDMPVWVGIYPYKAYKKYDIPHLKVTNRSYCHEIALRSFISYVQREFLKKGQIGIPLVSLSLDHYMRIAFRKSRGETDVIIKDTGYIIECLECFERWKVSLKSNLTDLETKCSTCGGSKLNFIGPLWLGPLHDDAFLSKLQIYLKQLSSNEFMTIRRLKKITIAMIEENKILVPWYFDLHWLSKKFRKSLPATQKVIEIIKKSGHNCHITHFSGKGIKTDLNFSDLKKILLS